MMESATSRTTDANDDAALVRRCVAGDGTAWTLLVERYQRLVYAIVRRAGLDEHAAADVFQTVFARLIEHLPRLNDPGRLQAWIVTTAKREAILQHSRARRTVSLTRPDDDTHEALVAEPPDESPLPEEALAELQLLHRLRLALHELDARCRDLLVMMFADDDEKPSYEGMAQRLQMPVGSLGPTRARCLDKLRRRMQ